MDGLLIRDIVVVVFLRVLVCLLSGILDLDEFSVGLDLIIRGD